MKIIPKQVLRDECKYSLTQVSQDLWGKLSLIEESPDPYIPILHLVPVNHEVWSSSIPIRVTGWF